MILITDDDSAVRSSLSLLLKRGGHETHSVASPEAATDFVRHTVLDVVKIPKAQFSPVNLNERI